MQTKHTNDDGFTALVSLLVEEYPDDLVELGKLFAEVSGGKRANNRRRRANRPGRVLPPASVPATAQDALPGR